MHRKAAAAEASHAAAVRVAAAAPPPSPAPFTVPTHAAAYTTTTSLYTRQPPRTYSEQENATNHNNFSNTDNGIDRPIHVNERRGSYPNQEPESVVQQLISAFTPVRTSSPSQGSPVIAYIVHGVRIEYTGKGENDEAALFMVRFYLFRSMGLGRAFCRNTPTDKNSVLRTTFHPKKGEINDAFRAWNLLVNSMVDVCMLVRITADYSRSGEWKIFKEYHTPQADAEKERVSQEELYDL